MAQKTVIVASGTGSPGIKQVNVLLTGPTGPSQLPNWTQATTQGYPANLPTVQATNTLISYLESVVMPNFSGGGVNSNFNFNFAAGLVGTQASNFSAVNSGGFAQNVDGTLNTFGANQPRISTQGLLVEPAATNLMIGTATLGSSYTASFATATPATGPDGSQNAIQLTDNISTNVHQIFLPTNSVTTVNGTVYTASVYAKAGTIQFLQLTYQFNSFSGAGYADFDLINGTVASTGGTLINSGIIQYPNGWCRCWITAQATSATATAGFNIEMQLLGSALRNATYLGTGTGTIFLFGPQQEANSFPTSYVVSGAAATTRTADNISILGSFLSLLQTGNARATITTNFMRASAAATIIGIGSGTAVLAAVDASNRMITNLGNLVNTGAATWTTSLTTYCAWTALRGSAVRVPNFTSPVSGQGLVANSGASATLGSNGNGSNYLNGYLTSLSITNINAAQPPLAAVMFYDRRTFFDDFTSLSTIDVNNTKAAGFNWYPNNQWPNAGQTGYRTIGPSPPTAFSVTGSIMTMSDSSHLGLVSAVPVGPSGLTFTGFAAAGPTGAYFEALMAFNPSNALASEATWPAFWMHGMNTWLDPTQTQYPEVDFFEASITGTGTIHPISTVHNWFITATGTNDNNDSNNNLMVCTGITGATQTSQHVYGYFWLTAGANGGTGIMMPAFDNTTLAGNRVLYGSGPAQPSFVPADPAGTMFVAENDFWAPILSAGPSGTFNSEWDSVSVWQP